MSNDAFAREEGGVRFKDLVEEWKDFHFMRIGLGTRLLYERKLPALVYLNERSVNDITTSTIDGLVKFWIKEWPRARGRCTFDKELDLLTVILNFYRSRKKGDYLIPISKEHYEAAVVQRKGRSDVHALTEEDLARFLKRLREQKNPIYYPLAAVQFGLSLRIGEVCGLYWSSLDFIRSEAWIERVVHWNDRTWEAQIKEYPKNDHIRVLRIPDFLMEILQDWKKHSVRGSPLVFHNHGKLLNRKSVATAYNRTLRTLGIDYVSGTHMMRKTSATLANELTGDFYAVSKQLDHASPEVTKRYVKPVSSHKLKVATALNEAFHKSMTGTVCVEPRSESMKLELD